MRIGIAAIAIALFFLVHRSTAQTFPEGFALVTVGGAEPIIRFGTGFAFAPDGRIFVTQQNGFVRIIKDNVVLAEPFYQTAAEMDGERGMDGIAIDPDFDNNHYVYIYYTVPESPAHNRLIRVTADGDKAVTGSEQVILDLDNLSTANIHNGGGMVFGNDGKLYLGVGDNSNGANAKNLDSYFGKILRINKDGSAPNDNPFPTGSEQRRRIWAYGFRNPFSLGFNSVTGEIFANEVGQSTVEEINDVTQPGLDFGWPASEGPTSDLAYQNPLYSYLHSGSTPSGCAITGGDFIPPNSNYPLEYAGKYFFVDFCSDWLYTIDPSDANPEATLFGTIGAFHLINAVAAPDGNLYFLNRGINVLQKLVYSDTGFPIITTNPITQLGIKGQSLTLTAAAAGEAPLTYQWMKDGENIDDATSSTYTIPSLNFGDAGEYTVKVTNNVGSVVTVPAKLTVTDNTRPVVKITAPSGIGKYIGGGAIDFAAVGSDQEDGNLPESAYQWYIDFHHDTHKHDQPPMTGSSGTFNVPDRGETSSNVWYRFIVTVTDIGGLTGADSVDVHPIVSQLTFKSDPPGLQITLDGQPVTTPYSVSGVAGIVREIGVITPQEMEGIEYDFVRWSIAGDAGQDIVTPNVNTEYVATYAAVTGLENNRYLLVVYPTITRDEVFIPWSPLEELPEIRVTDTYGRSYSIPVFRKTDELVVDMKSLPPAIYILKCNGFARKFTAKVAVVR